MRPPAPGFRAGGPVEAPAIAAAHRRAILTGGRRAYSLAECRSWAAGLSPALYTDAMEAGEEFELADGDCRLLGFCSRRGDTVIGLYVDPDAAGAGIGGSLLARAERAIAAAGHVAVRVKGALSALGFYRARGYRPLERQSWVTRGGLAIPVVLFIKELSRA